MQSPGNRGLIVEDLLPVAGGVRLADTIWDWKFCRACDAIEPPDHDCPYGSAFERMGPTGRVVLAAFVLLCLVLSLLLLAALGYGVSDIR